MGELGEDAYHYHEKSNKVILSDFPSVTLNRLKRCPKSPLPVVHKLHLSNRTKMQVCLMYLSALMMRAGCPTYLSRSDFIIERNSSKSISPFPSASISFWIWSTSASDGFSLHLKDLERDWSQTNRMKIKFSRFLWKDKKHRVYPPKTPYKCAQLLSVYSSPRVNVKLVKYLLVVGNLERREGVRGGDRWKGLQVFWWWHASAKYGAAVNSVHCSQWKRQG